MSGTVDFVRQSPVTGTDLSVRRADIVTKEAIAESAIGSKGDFPGPLFLAVAPIEVEWPQREELGRAITESDVDYDAMLRVSGGGRFTQYHRRFLFGSVADHLAEVFGTKGSPISLSTACASGATAIQLGVEAIRRGETDAALCVATDGSVNPEALVRFSLLSALSTHNDPPQRAAQKSSASSPAAANLRILSTAPAPAPTASRSLDACATHCRMPASSPTRSTTSTRTAPARRRTTRWSIWASRPCSASAPRKFRYRPTSRW